VTSANMSKQAWGDAINPKTGDMRIASWEIGVLIWPALFAEDAEMLGAFQKDMPDSNSNGVNSSPLVGLRIPYNLPLQRYSPAEIPWVATMSHREPDWRGARWVVADQ